ncbi:UMP kinase [Candidatus Nomurabacteria bacterium]|nr:UMP kinase [Candidatus Nomurabacteria bacterium]
MNTDTIIISLGGSLVVPDEIDVNFLKDFVGLISKEVASGKKFVIITGGGKICRKYQEAAKNIRELNSSELDWLGIYTTRLNAEFVKTLFGGLAEENIILDPTLPVKMTKQVLVAGGWKPGWSTDYDAVMLGLGLGAKKVINLSNINYAYDKDPNKYPDAKKIEKISWADYRALIPKEWNPGLNSPFDPIASAIAEREGMEVFILNGRKIDNLTKCLHGEEFLGTVIS